MEIRSATWYRVMWVVLGGILAAFAVWITIELYRAAGISLYLVLGALMTAIGLGSALIGGRPSWVRVDDQTLSYKPPVGKPKVAARSSVGEIVPQTGGRVGPFYTIRDKNGHKLFRIGGGCDSDDIERVARFIGVRFMPGQTLETLPLEELPPDVTSKVEQLLAEKARDAAAETDSPNEKST